MFELGSIIGWLFSCVGPVIAIFHWPTWLYKFNSLLIVEQRPVKMGASCSNLFPALSWLLLCIEPVIANLCSAHTVLRNKFNFLCI